jgi:hypothetical protein
VQIPVREAQTIRVVGASPFSEVVMKKLLVLALALGAIGAATAQPNVSVSIGINQPGVYGQINIGTPPPVALVAPQPVVVAPAFVATPPAYLYVPVAEQRNWRRYCRKYEACGRPVYFVREDWVRERYSHEHPGWDHGHGPVAHADRRHEERREHERHD